MRWRSPRTQTGFSLIEVVVALAIVALMLGAIYQVSNGAVRSTVRTDNYLRALAMAQSRLAEASAMPVLKVGTVLGYRLPSNDTGFRNESDATDLSG